MLEKLKKFYWNHRYLLILSIIFIIGILIRTIGFSRYPNALNVDESSAGYKSSSILQTGYDRNGNFLPVFLVAWRKWTKCIT